MAGFLEQHELVRAVLDALPLPVFVFDREVRVVDCNAAGVKFLGAAGAEFEHRLPGDVLRCVVALTSPGGCGSGDSCASCVLRGTIAASIVKGETVRRRGRLELAGESGPRTVHLRATVTAIPVADPGLRLLIVEDFTEIVELGGLVPICAGCKRIRSDKDYWERVENYFARRLEVSFTHGLCPECIREYFTGLPSGPHPADPAPAPARAEDPAPE